MMVWAMLILAGCEEIISTVMMKYVDGFRRKLPIIVMVLGFALSFYLLSKSMQVIPTGVAYAVWTGVGATGITLVDAIFFKEKFSRKQYAFLALVLIGVIGLRFTT